jgi:hypothetical protein
MSERPIRRWGFPILGSILVFLGWHLLGALPSMFTFFGNAVFIVGGLLCVASVPRVGLEAAWRLILSPTLLYWGLFAYRYHSEHLGHLTAYWVGLATLGVAIAGSALPWRLRRALYGLFLATGWGLLIRTVGDEFRSHPGSGVMLFIVVGGILALITAEYGRWARTGVLHPRIHLVLDQLFGDALTSRAVADDRCARLEAGGTSGADAAGDGGTTDGIAEAEVRTILR